MLFLLVILCIYIPGILCQSCEEDTSLIKPPNCVGNDTDTDTCSFVCKDECQCYNSTLICPHGMTCDVACSGVDSCLKSNIICESESMCNIVCDFGTNSCGKMNISALLANNLDLYCGDGDFCDDSILYCPVREIESCKATLIGNDNNDIFIYSQLGFKSFKFGDVSDRGSVESSVLLCDNNYCDNISFDNGGKCKIEWICDPETKENVFDCDNIIYNFTEKTIDCNNDNTLNCIYYCDEELCCSKSIINCNDNMPCILECNDKKSCYNSTINCPVYIIIHIIIKRKYIQYIQNT